MVHFHLVICKRPEMNAIWKKCASPFFFFFLTELWMRKKVSFCKLFPRSEVGWCLFIVWTGQGKKNSPTWMEIANSRSVSHFCLPVKEKQESKVKSGMGKIYKDISWKIIHKPEERHNSIIKDLGTSNVNILFHFMKRVSETRLSEWITEGFFYN